MERWSGVLVILALSVNISYQWKYGLKWSFDEGRYAASEEEMAEEQLAKDGTNEVEEREQCGYKGYTPYYNTDGISKMRHHMAQLQTTYMTDVYISEGFTKTLGGFGASSAADIYTMSTDYIKAAWPELLELERLDKKVDAKQIANFGKGLRLASKMLKIIGGMAPVVGVLVEIFGAVQGVRTPTHADILKSTNIALEKMTKEVDMKMAEMKGYVDEKVHNLEKEMITRKYKFLVTYWSECTNVATEIENRMCQREAYRLGLGGLDEFLLFRDLLDERKQQFNGLTEAQTRRLELAMLSFRNYAVWLQMTVKALIMQYKTLYEQEKSSPQMTCDELSLQELLNKTAKTIPINLKFYCRFQEEIVAKARYFKAFGTAAVKEIKRVAENRLGKKVKYAIEETKNFKGVGKWADGQLIGISKCGAKIHPGKKGLCKYYVQLVEYRQLGKLYGSRTQQGLTELDETYGDKIVIKNSTYEDTRKMPDGKDAIKERTADGWCHARVSRRRNEYVAMELPDIERYWSGEVLKVLECARLLAEGEAEDCFEETLKKFVPKAFESVLDLQKASIWGENETSKDSIYATDGLLDTVDMTTKVWDIQTTLWWKADLVKPAFVSEIHIYGWDQAKTAANFEEAKADFYQVGELGAVSRNVTSEYELSNGSLIFRWNNDKKQKLVLTSKAGKQIKSGYTKEYGTWKRPGTWKDNKNAYYIKNFRGVQDRNAHIYSYLKVETLGGKTKTNVCFQGDDKNPVFPTNSTVPFVCKCSTQNWIQDAVKISLGPENTFKQLVLAEVRVFGVVSDDDDSIAASPDTLAELTKPMQFPRGSQDTAWLAIDKQYSTMSKSAVKNENDSAIWRAKLKTPSIIKSIKVYLHGDYLYVIVEKSLDGKSWQRCGNETLNVNGEFLEGFEQLCDDKMANHVRVYTVPKLKVCKPPTKELNDVKWKQSTDCNKYWLMIKEVEVVIKNTNNPNVK